jgi:SAM-dependent methyltransferase
MPRIPKHPLAEYPLDGLPGRPTCMFPKSSRSYLSAVMLEGSLRHCAPYIRGRLLDVGCGRRPYEKTYFAGASEYVGADYLTDRSRPDIVCSALDLKVPDHSFDTVVSTEVLEHVPDPLRALREMRRALKPEGHLVLSVPMWWPRHEVPYDYFRYPYDGLLHLLRESGFELVRLFNRGRSYAFLGQIIQHIHPVPFAAFDWLVNWFFLMCDRKLKHDELTLGWTVVAKPATSVAATSAQGFEGAG